MYVLGLFTSASVKNPKCNVLQLVLWYFDLYRGGVDVTMLPSESQ